MQNKTYSFQLNDPWFRYVVEGKKEYEGRCHRSVAKECQIGDIIVFSHFTSPNDKNNQPFKNELLINLYILLLKKPY